MLTVVVTGANGFVGRHLCRFLLGRGCRVIGVVRSGKAVSLPSGVEAIEIDEYDACTLKNALNNLVDKAGIDAVVHLAARVHQMSQEVNAEDDYDRSNHQLTTSLAKIAVELGIKRFVFLSTIKVNGEESSRPYTAADIPQPVDPYGCSKLKAEQALLSAEFEDLEVVIIRPPLVYGEGVKANFNQLLSWVKKGVPLPLDRVNNRRSFISVDNLVDLIGLCLQHPVATGKVWLASDGEAISTTELIRRIALSFGKRSRLFYLPRSILFGLAGLVGRHSSASRLLDTLELDITATRSELGWVPPVTMLDVLKRMAKDD